MRKKKPFATEAEMCAEFLTALPKEWTAYPETSGWDILLSRNSDGFQVGIEAKLKLNVRVVSQALEEWGGWSADRAGPDCRAVLVPRGESGFERIAGYIGLTIIRVTPAAESRFSSLPGASFFPSLPGASFFPSLPGGHSDRDWHEWMPAQRHRLPDYIPDVPAGVPAPVQLTPWKVKALKLMILSERRGFITRQDFKHLGLDHRPFVAAEGWLRPTGERGRYAVHSPAPLRLKEQHPRVYEEIKADVEKWAPPPASRA